MFPHYGIEIAIEYSIYVISKQADLSFCKYKFEIQYFFILFQIVNTLTSKQTSK